MVDSSLEIKNGTCLLSGTIEAKRFYYSSTKTIFKLNEPNFLNINGDCFFDETSTIFLTLYGTEFEKNERININGTLFLNAFLYLKIENTFNADIDTRIPIFQFKNLTLIEKLNVQVAGLIYRGGVMEQKGNILYVKIVLSFGSVEQLGYKCTYLGKRKVLEINHYASQEKTSLILTVPKRENVRYGFGIDLDNRTSIFTLSTNAENKKAVQLMNHLNSSTSVEVFDVQIFESQSIFKIGPSYVTLIIFIDSKLLTSQSKIYYAEIPNISGNSTNNSTNNIPSHYYEVFDYKVLSSEHTDCTNFLQPSRAETYSLPATIIVLIIYGILFILCIVFKSQRPLNTRGIDPFLTLIFIFVQLIMEMKNYYEISEFQGSLCLYLAYGIYPLQTICFFINLFYFLRYFAIINLSENKKGIYRRMQENKEIEKFLKIKNRILKIASSPILTAGLVFISFILLNLCYSIILGSYKGVCKFETLILLYSFQYSLMIIVYILTLLTFLFDIIMNAKMIFLKGQLKRYIFDRDPHLFRVQALLYLPFMLYSLGSGIFLLVTSTKFLDIIKYHNASMALNTTTCILLLIIHVLFPLIASIYIYIRGIFHKKQKILPGSLEMITSNNLLKEKFVKFCESEYTEENIYCYLHIIEYQHNKGKFNEAEIYLLYFNGGNSTFEVNISKTETKKLLDKIAKSKTTDLHVFDEVLKVIYQNLSENSLLSFKRTDFYKQWVKENMNQIELLEGNTSQKTEINKA